MAVVIARIRVLLPMLGLLLLLVGLFADVGLLGVVGMILLIAGMACYFVLGRVRGEPVRVRLPVTGRWVALNSPANRVPSHGTHAYGQTYALDLVHDPVQRPRPAFGSTWGFRPPAEFPAFGQPVLAPADGVVVRMYDRARDHRAAIPGLGSCICWSRHLCANCSAPGGSWATTSCSISATRCTRYWPICGGTPRG